MSSVLRLLRLAEEEGLTPFPTTTSLSDNKALPYEEIGQTFWIEAPMPASVREAGLADNSLEHLHSNAGHWEPESEGFVDRNAGEAIVFNQSVGKGR